MLEKVARGVWRKEMLRCYHVLSFRLLVRRLGCLDSAKAGNATVVYMTVPEALPGPDTFLFPLHFGLDR